MNELYNKNGNLIKNVWKNIDNHKLYADWLGKELGYTKPEDWYNIKQKDIKNNKGGGLLQLYNGSPIQFLRGVYPDYEWLEWKLGVVSKDFWQDKENHKLYADWLGKKLGYTKPEYWYNITKNTIYDNDGCGLISNYYNDSPIQFLRGVYPDYEWLEWNFKSTSNGFWQDTKNHKLYADWLGKELGYTEVEHWYNITQNIINDNYGCGLLGYYNGSPIQFLREIYPDFKWLEWKFKSTLKCFWQDKENHKLYADWLGKKLGYTELEHWYNITCEIISDNDGNGLLQLYNGSPIQFLRGVYPDYEWLEWKLGVVSRNFWQDKENHKLYADWLGKKLGYTEPEHWYNITQKIINNNNGGGLLVSYYSSYIEIPKLVYPEYEWDKTKFYIYKTEAKLYNLLITIYPTTIRQFKQDWCKKINHLPFDFCIPEYKIIIELDGRQHFQQVSNWSSPEEQFENDTYKEKCANDNNYSVIRLLQEDVFDDTYDWFKKLCDAIEEIKNGDEVANIYLCNNGEYHRF